MSDERITGLPAVSAAPAGAAEWYVIHAGKERGPYTVAELVDQAAAGELAADDLVKQAGGLWTKAREFGFLQQEFLLRESREKAIAKLGQFHGIWLSKKALVIVAVFVFIGSFSVVWMIVRPTNPAPAELDCMAHVGFTHTHASRARDALKCE